MLDISLGSDNGLELIPEIVEQDPGVRIVVVTGQATIDTAVLAMRAGAVDFAARPVPTDQLIARVMGWRLDDASEPASLDRVNWEHAHRVYVGCGQKLRTAAAKLGITPARLRRILDRGPPAR